MARKVLSALALVALLSSAACNEVMGPIAVPEPGSINRGTGRPSQPRDTKPPMDGWGKADYVPDPGDGGGPGDSHLGRNGQLGRSRGPIHVREDLDLGGGGDIVPIDPSRAEPVRRRGTAYGQPG